MRRPRLWTAVLGVIASLSVVACSPPKSAEPMCRPGPPTVLMAESVPSATLVPCVRELPNGWSFHGFTADESGATFTLEREGDLGGLAVITLKPTCDTIGHQQRSVRPGVRQFLHTSANGETRTWTSVFAGGCVVEHVSLASAHGFGRDASTIHHAIGFLSRDALTPSR